MEREREKLRKRMIREKRDKRDEKRVRQNGKERVN